MPANSTYRLLKSLPLVLVCLLLSLPLAAQEHTEGNRKGNTDLRMRENMGEEAMESSRKKILKQLEKELLKPYLGIELEEKNGGPTGRIKKVIPGSPAEQRGMGREDELLEIGDIDLSELEGNPEIPEYETGEEIEIVYLRNGKRETATLTLGPGNGFFAPPPPLEEIDLVEIGEAEPGEKPCNESQILHFATDLSTFLGILPDLNYRSSGVRLLGTLENTTAHAMRLRKDDIITEVNGVIVEDLSELRYELKKIPNDTKYNLQLVRQGRNMLLYGESETHAENYEQIRALHCRRTCGCNPVTGTGKGTTFTLPNGQIRITIDELTGAETASLVGANHAFSKDNSLDPETLSLFPHPTKGTFVLKLNLKKVAPVTLMVLDQDLHTVFYNQVADFTGGELTYEVDLSEQARGVYYLQITQLGKGIARKVVTD